MVISFRMVSYKSRQKKKYRMVNMRCIGCMMEETIQMKVSSAERKQDAYNSYSMSVSGKTDRTLSKHMAS
jgi:hypothetical protein